MSLLRSLVSKKKRRYVGHGFNLDLTYITSRIIAMGFPSIKMEGVYRNNMADVSRFFEQFHKDCYMIYNLYGPPCLQSLTLVRCSERSYDPTPFQGRVQRFPFDDHNAPPMSMIEPFCRSVDEWLGKNPDNIVAIHCKAGKGRTGVLICIYLLHAGICKTADEAMDFYGVARTKDNKGLTIPSQRRYVRYYEQVLRFGMPPPQTLRLTNIQLVPTPDFNVGGGCEPYFRITYRKRGSEIASVYSSKEHISLRKYTKRDAMCDLVIPGGLEVCDDVKIELFHKGMKKTKMFHFWINVDFVADNQVALDKWVLDGANKDRKHSKYAADFQAVLLFQPVDQISTADMDIAAEASHAQAN